MITVECKPWVGLGTAINVLSLINSLNDNVTIITNSRSSIYHQLLEVFPLKHISISFGNISDQALGSSDFSKVVSRYFSIPNLHNQAKNVIVLTRFNGQVTDDVPYEIPNNAFPYNRYYSQSIYDHLAVIAKQAGYEVVTINHNRMPLDELVRFLQIRCSAVIGYEGGIAHLAHVLEIPTITFPWHHQTDGKPLRDIYDTPNESHLFHLDQRTYIPDNVSDLLNWSPDMLIHTIRQLEDGLGNNKYIGSYTVKKAHSQLWFCPGDRRKSTVRPPCSKVEFDLIDKFLPTEITPGGF